MKLKWLSLLLFSPLFLPGQSGFLLESATAAGLQHLHAAPLSMGAGAAFFDYNNDYYEDLYLTGGKLADHLFRNNGDGTFTDVTIPARITHPDDIMTHGVVTGDLDNDGFRDILITVSRYNAPQDRQPILYRNQGDGTFERLYNIPFSPPVDDQDSFTATLGDVNLDGLLDIYICNWVDQAELLFDSLTRKVQGFAHRGGPNRLYLNNGNMTFTEVAKSYGVADRGCSLAAVFSDYDNDRDPDLLVVNDFGMWDRPDGLYRNNYPQMGFSDESAASGFATALYGMGIGVGDYDRDGDLDYYKTSIGSAVLLQNQNDGTFREVAAIAGVADTYVGGQAPWVSAHWGAGFADLDQDGWLDLVVAKGRIGSEDLFPSPDAMPDQIWHNLGDGTFADAAHWLQPPNLQPAHGLAYADYDNDGDLDLLFANAQEKLQYPEPGRPLLYKNQGSAEGNWLKVKTVGTINNRDGFGAQLLIFVNGVSWRHEIGGGGQGHLSQHSSVAHFGLGTAAMVDSLRVLWPGHLSPDQVFYNIPANQYLEITEAELFFRVIQPGGTNAADDVAADPMALRLFPNPATQSVSVRLNKAAAGAATLHLYDPYGQLLKIENLLRIGPALYTDLDVNHLPSGLYLLTVRSGKRHWCQKLVIR